MKETRVLVVTDRSLVPADRGNRRRIINLMQALRISGYYVTLLTLTSCAHPLLGSFADHVILTSGEAFKNGSPVDFYSVELCLAVSEFTKSGSTVVIVEYVYLAHCLDHAKREDLRIIDTHDLMHKRSEFDDSWIKCTRSQEVDLLSRANAVLAIQNEEAVILASMAPHAKVITVPHASDYAGPIISAPANSRIAMMIGSSHPGNHGMIVFAERFWLHTREVCPGATLNVYGHICEHIPDMIPGIDRKEYVDDRGLDKAYARSALVLAPLTNGTGIKIKVIESLARGKTVLTTEVGAQGLERGYERAMVICNDLKELAISAGKLMRDSRKRRYIEGKAKEYVIEKYSMQASVSELIELIESFA